VAALYYVCQSFFLLLETQMRVKLWGLGPLFCCLQAHKFEPIPSLFNRLQQQQQQQQQQQEEEVEEEEEEEEEKLIGTPLF
jgi:hypothetical protein